MITWYMGNIFSIDFSKILNRLSYDFQPVHRQFCHIWYTYVLPFIWESYEKHMCIICISNHMSIICGKSYENHMNKHMLIICSKIHMILIWFDTYMRTIWMFWMSSYENHMKQICLGNLLNTMFSMQYYDFFALLWTADEIVKLSDDEDWNLRSAVNFWYITHG